MSHITTIIAICNIKGDDARMIFANHHQLIDSELGGQAVLLQFPVEGRSIDFHGLSRFAHIVTGDLERVEQRLSLEFRQRADRIRRRSFPLALATLG